MSEGEEVQGQSGDGSPKPIGEIASMLERTPPAPAPAAPEHPAIEPIGEIESMIERSPKPA